MIDPSKFVDYPIWAKLLVLVWVVLTLFLVVLLLWKPHQKPQNQPPSLKPIANQIELQKEQKDILLILLESGERLTFQIAQRLNMEKKEEIVKYHLQKLARRGFATEIDLPGIGPWGQSSWAINDQGKKYLIENKIIS